MDGILFNQTSILFENVLLYKYLITTTQRLPKLNGQKSEFLHRVAHDLRMPLNNMRSDVVLLLMYKASD